PAHAQPARIVGQARPRVHRGRSPAGADGHRRGVRLGRRLRGMSEVEGQDLGTTVRSTAVFDRRVESASDARAWLTAFLAEHDLDEPTVMDAALVTSELVTNALRHGAGASVLRVGLNDGEVQLSV